MCIRDRSRTTEEMTAVRRRRECPDCGRRFTTYERVEEQLLVVVKKDGRREFFSRQKILSGMLKACEKRPTSLEVQMCIRDRGQFNEVRILADNVGWSMF